MQHVLKRHVGYGSRGSRLVRPRSGTRVGGDLVRERRRPEADVLALVRSVETSLAGRLSVSVLVEACDPAPADLTFSVGSPNITAGGDLVDSLAALVRAAASSSGEMGRGVRITLARREIGTGSASAAGIVPGAYVVLEIEDHIEGDRRLTAGAAAVGPGIGLAAARAVIVGAGGSIGSSRSVTGGVRFTVFMPACRARATNGAA